MKNGVRILRDLEYINGGITTLKSLCQEKDANFKQCIDEWQDIICGIIDMIEEDYKNAENS